MGDRFTAPAPSTVDHTTWRSAPTMEVACQADMVEKNDNHQSEQHNEMPPLIDADDDDFVSCMGDSDGDVATPEQSDNPVVPPFPLHNHAAFPMDQIKPTEHSSTQTEFFRCSCTRFDWT